MKTINLIGKYLHGFPSIDRRFQTPSGSYTAGLGDREFGGIITEVSKNKNSATIYWKESNECVGGSVTIKRISIKISIDEYKELETKGFYRGNSKDIHLYMDASCIWKRHHHKPYTKLKFFEK